MITARDFGVLGQEASVKTVRFNDNQSCHHLANPHSSRGIRRIRGTTAMKDDNFRLRVQETTTQQAVEDRNLQGMQECLLLPRKMLPDRLLRT